MHHHIATHLLRVPLFNNTSRFMFNSKLILQTTVIGLKKKTISEKQFCKFTFWDSLVLFPAWCCFNEKIGLHLIFWMALEMMVRGPPKIKRSHIVLSRTYRFWKSSRYMLFEWQFLKKNIRETDKSYSLYFKKCKFDIFMQIKKCIYILLVTFI